MTSHPSTDDVSPVQAMLLAAGLGTRLHPLTTDRAKPAVPFLGKPLIAGLVELLHAHGIQDAVVNTHHLPQSIHRALEGLEGIAYSHEDTILGTAGALAAARERGLLDPKKRTLIINAKLYTDVDLTQAIAAHVRSKAMVTMVLRPNVDREAFREVLVDGDRVVGLGKGRVPDGPSPLLFTGIHIIEPEVLASIPNAPCDTVADVYPPLIEAKKIAAHIEPRGRWWEFSTLERYLELHLRVRSVSASAGVLIDRSAIVERSVLWENARVEAGAIVRDSIIGAGERIPAGAIVERSAIVGAHRVEIPAS